MGLSYTDVRQLLRARRDGAEFGAVLTIGRQTLHLHDQDVASLAREFGIDATRMATPLGAFADDFLRAALGAERVESMDASAYEG
ncbi:MAG: hypothetical protein QOJ29_1446, partial [Thermoleophilaceae bacterium]|nr:hypothetical protein [Thermoleophilaceae bacterium]